MRIPCIVHTMNTQERMRFPAMCREMRLERHLKQREVSNALGLRGSTYGNVECNNHKTISLERVMRLARFYVLDQAATNDLIAAWEELPASEYTIRNAPARARRAQQRGKVKNHDRLKLALLEVTTQLVTTAADPSTLCSCAEVDLFADAPDEPAPPCELCNALQLLGMTGWTDLDDVVGKLAALQEEMTK